MKLSKRWLWILISLLGLAACLLLLGIGYEQSARARINRKLIPQGQMVSIGDHSLHMNSEGAGEPTVVFEAGLDPGGSLEWFKVQGPVAEFTSTVSYDRAGIMWSERGSNPKTGSAIADELYALLKKTHHNGPYVLVGYSLAGLTLRSFVAKHAKEVAGVVLVDAWSPDLSGSFPEAAKSVMAYPPAWVVNIEASTGLARWLMKTQYPGTSATDTINMLVNDHLPASLPATMEEYKSFTKLAGEAVQTASFGDIPLIVITPLGEGVTAGLPAGEGIRVYNMWMQMQTTLMELSTNSEHIYANNSGHCVQLEKPQIVIDAIKKLVEKIRVNNKPAPGHAATTTSP